MSHAARRSWIALALQLAALAVLSMSLLGVRWLDPRGQPRWLVLVDRSDSVPRADADQALAGVRQAAHAVRAVEPRVIEFAGRVAAGGTDATALESWATNIESALLAALQADADPATRLDGVVLVSDGFQNAGDAQPALRAARQAGLPVQWLAVARPPPPARLADVRAPARALAGQRVQVDVRIDVQGAEPPDQRLRVRLTVHGTGATPTVLVGEVDASGRATMEFDATQVGVQLLDVALEDAASGQLRDVWKDAAVVDVAPRAALLYVQGSPAGALRQSLARGGWPLQRVSATQLDAQADALPAYRAVVLDDVAITDAGARFWSALAQAVRRDGLGLLVLGGERAFALGGYRDSALEALLPVLSEPPALGQPTAVVFAVDKSGSMGEGSGGVDRFRLAQRAVLQAARSLDARDAFGLLVFDVAPRVLLPLGPADAGIPALARDWPASPRGGTRLAPALSAAIDELERSAQARRLLVLVTDGFVDDAPLAELRARLERARIETLALAVGPDADVAALQRLFGGDAGTVLRVEQAADLPLAMRSGLERRRARIERGPIGVAQREALPFAPGTFSDWPAVTAYAVTRPRPEARVAVRSERGDPLIAWQSVGRGRVAAVTSGFGPWTPAWLSWREWPQLAGGLADWSMGGARGAQAALAITELPGGLRIETDLPTPGGPVEAAAPTLMVTTPTRRDLALAMAPAGPGRWRATWPDAAPGLYSFALSDARDARPQWHLRRQRAENQDWGTNPTLQAWQTEGLLARWDPNRLQRTHDGPQTRRPADRSLMLLALALFVAGLVVDRGLSPWAGVSRWLRSWHARALRRRGR